MKRLDPLALAFFGGALALLAGLLLYVVFFKMPEPAQPSRALPFLESLRRQVADLIAQKPAAKPAAAPTTAPAAATTAFPALQPGHTWKYAVVVEPPAWRDVTLTYRTQAEGSGIGVMTDFVHAAGKMNFHLGTYAPGHPTHANTRFPGFFMYASYFRQPLQPGQKLNWNWAWQPVKQDRKKAWDGQVLRWEDVKVPAGTFRAALIETKLYYIEGGVVRAQAKETLWYAPQVAQIVKVVRDGRTPDEGSTRIVAELQEYR